MQHRNCILKNDNENCIKLPESFFERVAQIKKRDFRGVHFFSASKEQQCNCVPQENAGKTVLEQ